MSASFGLDDNEYDILQEDVEQQIDEANHKNGYDGRNGAELLSVELALRKDFGYYAVRGMIVGMRERFLESPPVADGLISITSHNPLTLV